MRAADLHRLSRLLREVAIESSGDPGERPTFGEIAVVEDLARHGASSVGAIAARTGVAQSLVSKVVAALVAGGIVTTAPDGSDGRRRVVELGEGVREGLLLPRGERTVTDAIRAAAPHLDEPGAARAEALLVDLAALLDPPAR